MNDRAHYTSADGLAISVEHPEFVKLSEDDQDSILLAARFGWEIRSGIPDDGSWALDKHCVLGLWTRRPGEKAWTCLDCYGSYVWDSAIRETFMAELRAANALAEEE